MIFSPFFSFFALDIFSLSPPKRFFFLPAGFCFLLNFKSSLLDWSYVGGNFAFARLMSFSVYLLFWMYPITEPLKKEKKNELKRTLTHLFVLILKELYICNWSGKAFYYLFIYLLKLIPNLKSGIQSEFFSLAIFFFQFSL